MLSSDETELILHSFVLEPGAPVLKTVNLGATFINTTWIVESRSVNRCPLRSFYVDGGNYFNFSVPITDTPERQPVPINLQSLRPNSLYILRTSVGNNAGVSRPAIVGVQTLDLDPSV